MDESLKNTFKSAVKHIFSPTMLIMMAVMAFPAVAAAAPTGAATIGDLGMGFLDHYGTMFTAPFTEAGMLSDVFTNTVNGEFAASSYEFGNAHTAHGGAEAVTHAGHQSHAVPSGQPQLSETAKQILELD